MYGMYVLRTSRHAHTKVNTSRVNASLLVELSNCLVFGPDGNGYVRGLAKVTTDQSGLTPFTACAALTAADGHAAQLLDRSQGPFQLRPLHRG